MDVAWQDSVGSFLDSFATDGEGSPGGFASGDNGVVWSDTADNSAFTGTDSLLWNDASVHWSNADPSLILAGDLGPPGTASFASDNSLPATNLLWTDPSDNTSINVSIAGAGAGMDNTFPLGPASDNAPRSLLFTNASSSDILWTATPDGASPALTLPTTVNSQALHLADGGSVPDLSFPTLAPQQLVWTDPSSLAIAQSGGSVILTFGTLGGNDVGIDNLPRVGHS
jgi:hypothetical protein